MGFLRITGTIIQTGPPRATQRDGLTLIIGSTHPAVKIVPVDSASDRGRHGLLLGGSRCRNSCPRRPLRPRASLALRRHFHFPDPFFHFFSGLERDYVLRFHLNPGTSPRVTRFARLTP